MIDLTQNTQLGTQNNSQMATLFNKIWLGNRVLSYKKVWK